MQLRKTLAGHGGPVSCARFDLDGKRIATGSRDKSLAVWSVRTGKLERTLSGHRRAVTALCFTPSGDLLSADANGVIGRWSWPKGKQLWALDAHDGAIYTLGCSADGAWIASGGADQTVAIWSGDRGELVHRLDVGPRGMSFAFSGDGEHLVTGHHGDTLRFWSLETGKVAWEQLAGPGTVGAFEPALAGEWLVSRGWRGPITIWSRHNWGYTAVLPIIENGLAGAALRPGHEQVVCIWDRAIGSFDALTGAPIHRGEIPSKGVNGLDISCDGHLAVTASDDKIARLWSL